MAKAGRKGWLEELQLAQRYSDLTEPFFKVIRDNLESEDKADRKWAAERLEKAYVKMIPQDVTSGGEAITFNLLTDVAAKYNADTSAKEDSDQS